MATGTALLLGLIFGNLAHNRRDIEDLSPLVGYDGKTGKVSTTLFTAFDGQPDRVGWLIHHLESLSGMTGLTSRGLTGLFPQILDRERPGLTGRNITVVAIFMYLGF